MAHGSFTGIRIGVSAVKALAEIGKIPVAEVTSLEALSVNIKKTKTKVALIDARNNQVYCGIFDENNNLKEDYLADSIEVAIEHISKYNDITVCGNGATVNSGLIKTSLPEVKFAEENSQLAINTGIMGLKKYNENNLKNADELMPSYLRKSRGRKNEEKLNRGRNDNIKNGIRRFV